MDDLNGITTGSQFLSATGRLWTVRSVAPTGTRVMLVSVESDGQHGAMVDIAAVRRMVRVDREAAPTATQQPLPTPTAAATATADLVRT